MANKHCDIRMNTQFARVIEWCAQRPSKKNVSQGESIASQSETQDSSSHAPAPTWIVPQMQEVYTQAHHAGLVHSVETWIDQELVGGLYFVAIGSALYGESMFSRQKDASKIALAALVAFCKAHGIEQIDCQQNTAHLASLGAAEVPRAHFLKEAAKAQLKPPPAWRFDKSHWHKLGI
jgi:leucyl/phenylalanyl-tRNA--protein transferase